MTPRQKVIFITARTMLAILVVGFGMPMARPYLEARLGIQIDKDFYFYLWLVVFAIALLLSRRGLMEELKKIEAERKAAAKRRRPVINPIKSNVNTVYRCKRQYFIFNAGFAIFMLTGVPATTTFAGRVFLGCFVVAMVPLILESLRYSVVVTEDEIRITGLKKTNIYRRSEIKDAQVRGSLGKGIVLTLNDGRKAVISSRIAHFSDVVAILGASEQ